MRKLIIIGVLFFSVCSQAYFEIIASVKNLPVDTIFEVGEDINILPRTDRVFLGHCRMHLNQTSKKDRVLKAGTKFRLTDLKVNVSEINLYVDHPGIKKIDCIRDKSVREGEPVFTSEHFFLIVLPSIVEI